MRLERFDLNLLIVLDALLEERNVTRASERLFISQSGASAALTRLREYFGDELLVSVGRRLELTPLAKSLAGPVRDTLLRARATLALRPDFDPTTVERRFSVCASDYVLSVVLVNAVRRLAQQAPGIALDLRFPTPDAFDLFDRGNIDLMVLPSQYADRIAHPHQLLFEDTQVCIVWEHHRLAEIGLTMADYLAQGHVCVRFGKERTLSFEEWFLPIDGRRRRIECSVDSFSALPQLVVGTQRIATVHRRQAEQFAQRFPVRLLDPPFDMPPVRNTMFWPTYLELDPVHRWLRNILLEAAAAPAETGTPSPTNG
jgi:DNA-binding transcriptional LysR family regulator